MKVEVKPLPIEKWHKKEGRDSFSQPQTFEVLYNRNTGQYNSGLTDEQAAEFSKQMGVDLSNVYIHDKPHPYYSTRAGMIKLENHTIVFNTEIPAQAVKVYNMKASDQVANSLEEWKQGLWPKATHVIYSEAEEVEAKASKIEAKERIIRKLGEFSTEDKVTIIMAMTNVNMKGQSPSFLTVALNELMEDRPLDLIEVMKQSREIRNNRYSVLLGLQKRVFTKEGMSIMYMGEEFAPSLEAAIDRLADTNNQAFKATILQKINS